jgi:hypothetical protein
MPADILWPFRRLSGGQACIWNLAIAACKVAALRLSTARPNRPGRPEQMEKSNRFKELRA